MPAAIAAILGILVQIGMKLIGYEFVTTVLIDSLEAWAKTTKTHWDDDVVKAAADALGVPIKNLQVDPNANP